MKKMITAAATAALLAGVTIANAQSSNNNRVPTPDAPAANQAGTLPQGAVPPDSKPPSMSKGSSTSGAGIGNPGAGQPGKSQRDQGTAKGPVMDSPPGGGGAPAK